MNGKIFTLNKKIVPGKDGVLVAIENSPNIPFEIKRVFYIFGLSESSVRGDHANKNLDEVIVAIRGSCDIFLDDGKTKTAFKLDDPCTFLYVGANTWIDMKNFRNDCILLVLCSEIYEKTLVIRNYDTFLSSVNS